MSNRRFLPLVAVVTRCLGQIVLEWRMYTKIKGCRLSDWKMHALITEWCYATPAAVCAKKLNLSRTTVNMWYQRIQDKILHLPPPPQFTGVVEVDESYFGKKPYWMKGTGMVGKVPIFGIRSRETGAVWATTMSGAPSQKTVVPIIMSMVETGSTIYSDGFGAYAPLRSHGYTHHIVYHAHTYVGSFDVHTNGIESFWRYLRHFFRSKRTLHKSLYQLYLQEALFRFNTRDPKKLRRVVRKLLNSS